MSNAMKKHIYGLYDIYLFKVCVVIQILYQGGHYKSFSCVVFYVYPVGYCIVIRALGLSRFTHITIRFDSVRS